MAFHVQYMEYALSLAELALGYTSPNPAVGAVVVKDGVVVGMGYTQPPGSAHAEVVALQQAKERAKDATMYVILEPCSHHGRTPPCTEAIIKAGISTVHIAMVDPNPLVCGKGVARLKDAGIRVIIGEYEEEARQINESYIKYITTGIPFVVAKYAMSLDGKIATKDGDSKWISGEESRKYVHKLRQQVDAIMVGVNTVIKDNPRLSARGCCGGKGGKLIQQPLRIILDGKGRMPVESRVFHEPGHTVVVVASRLSEQKEKELVEAGAEILVLEGEGDIINLEQLLEVLGERQITSLLVEGGSHLLGALIDQGLIDKVMVFIAPLIVGGSEATSAVAGRGASLISEALRLRDVEMRTFGDDVLVSGYVSKS